jgi:hypothetical protein
MTTKLSPHIHIQSHTAQKASMQLFVALNGSNYGVHAAAAPVEVVAGLKVTGATSPNVAVRSNFFDTNVNVESDRGPTFETVEDVMPKESDYIYPLFRALSAVIIEGYWTEFPADVLKASAPLLQGQTVYKNHDYSDVERWLGVVNQVEWDALGQSSNGVPGLNTELKIDWKVNPRIARGLLMTPPAIHSVSVTVIFTYDYSHPELEKEGRFWSLLGEEVDGEIVRLIVTEILGYWEISLVFQGADRLAKGIAGETDVDDMSASSASSTTGAAAAPPPAASPAQTTTASHAAPPEGPKEKATVKLTEAQKQKLGLTGHEGLELPEEVVLPAVERLADRAAAGETLLAEARAECLRVATLAEAGTDGPLEPALAEVINGAGAAQLSSLTKMYTAKAAARFTATCAACGAQGVSNRSSIETPPAVESNHARPRTSTANALH